MDLKLDDLKPWEKNPRKIEEDNFEGLMESVGRFGDIAGITFNVQTGRLVTGHQRVSVFRRLDDRQVSIEILKQYDQPTAKGTVALGYIYIDGEPFSLRVVSWTEKEETLANLEANNEYIQGEFVSEQLSELFSGFTMDELAPLRLDQLKPLVAETEGLEEDGFAEPKVAKYTFEIGDVIELGDHLIVCGDSTKSEFYEKIMGREKADLVFTDPPYNVDYKSAAGSGYNKDKYAHGGQIFSDDMEAEAYFEFIRDVSENLYAFSKESAELFMWHAHKFHDTIDKANAVVGWKYMQNIIWVKERFVLALGQLFHRSYETCMLMVKDFTKYTRNTTITNADDVWNKPKIEGPEDLDVWFVERDSSADYVHPTQKPVRLAELAFKRCSKRGDTVLDVFGGSGSTLMACEQMKRKARLIELDPFYVSAIVERYEKATGKTHTKREG